MMSQRADRPTVDTVLIADGQSLAVGGEDQIGGGAGLRVGIPVLAPEGGEKRPTARLPDRGV